MGKLALLVLVSCFVQVAAETIDHQCDQSMCRGVIPVRGGHDCWFGDDLPAACADGYEVEDLSNVTTIYDSASGMTFRYFACCPPGYTSPLLQECTDRVCSSSAGGTGKDCWADGPNEPMTCDGDDFPFPRKTGAEVFHHSRWYSHYICCRTSDGTPPLKRSLAIAEGIRTALGSLGLCCCLILTLGIALLTKDQVAHV